ncbi:hypothetical protein HDU82_006907 [Entophlyctis luteolus]|nr:hypothetical protein HDU82_006907 [Entophlyctis luteolus]KAJ3379223.1 hypothetical protein HDU84_006833 [Entophlyctis sp. JEL0112]
MQEGDWLVYYSPKEDMSKASKAVQCFTAIGRVVSAKPYQVQMTDDFNPFRVEVQYVPGCHDAAAVPLVGQMQVFSGKHKTRWGLVMRRGHFEIPEGDFRLVAEAMNADLGRLGGDRAAT